MATTAHIRITLINNKGEVVSETVDFVHILNDRAMFNLKTIKDEHPDCVRVIADMAI